MALASRAKFYLKNKNGNFSQRLPFKGQMSEMRYVPLKEVTDGVQLDNIKSHLWKMEKDLKNLLVQYEEDAKHRDVTKVKRPKLIKSLVQSKL